MALSGAGAGATNVILTKTNSHITNSKIVSKTNVDLDADNSSDIDAVLATASAAAAGGAVGVGASMGVSISQNFIGHTAAGVRTPLEVKSYVSNSSIAAVGNISLDAVSTATVDAIVLAGSVAFAAGGLQLYVVADTGDSRGPLGKLARFIPLDPGLVAPGQFQ